MLQPVQYVSQNSLLQESGVILFNIIGNLSITEIDNILYQKNSTISQFLRVKKNLGSKYCPTTGYKRSIQ